MTNIGLKFDELIVFIDISDVLDEVNAYSNTNEFSQDSGSQDSGSQDSGSQDSGSQDSGSQDSGSQDSGSQYSGSQYSGSQDSGSQYSGSQYSGSQDSTINSKTSTSSGFFSTKSLKLFIANNSLITYFLINRVYDSFKLHREGYNLNMRQSLWTIDDKVYQEYGDLGLSKATYHMDLLYELLEKYEVPLTIAVYPWPDQIVNHDLNSIQVKHWQTWANEKGVKFLNYFPSFIKDGCDEACRYKVLDDYYINGDVHWNERGHKLIAETFLSTKPNP